MSAKPSRSTDKAPSSPLGGSGHQQPSPYRHLVPSILEYMHIHREFFVAGLRSSDLLQAFLKQLPVATRRSVEEFGATLKEKLVAASSEKNSSSNNGSAFDGNRGHSNTFSSPLRGTHLSLGPSTPTKYSDTQKEHLKKYREALIGAPDKPCEPTDDEILPSQAQFGLAQGDPKRLRMFLAMPCNAEVVLFLHQIFVGGKESQITTHSNNNSHSNNSGNNGGDESSSLGSSGHQNLSSNTLTQLASSRISEALQFAATMWIQRHPNDPAAQVLEQQRCRKAGVALSHHDTLRMINEEQVHQARLTKIEAAANSSRAKDGVAVIAASKDSSAANKGNSTQSAAAAASSEIAGVSDVNEEQEDGEGEEREGDEDADDDSSPSSSAQMDYLNSSQNAAGVMLLPKVNSPASAWGPINHPTSSTTAAAKSQLRLERQMKQLLVCNLQLHFPNEAGSWTMLLAARDECLQNIKDERVALEKLTAELNVQQGTNGPLASSFVKLIVLAENACNGLSHTNYNATPTDIANLLVSKLSAIAIEANLLKATQLQEAMAAVAGKSLDEIKELIEAQKKFEVDAATKKGPLNFIAKKLNKKDTSAPSPVSYLELSAAHHLEELATIANKCLKATQVVGKSP